MVMPTNRGQGWEMFLNPAQVANPDEDEFWKNLCNRAAGGKLIPVISGSMTYDLVFSKMMAGGPAGAGGPRLKPSASDVLSMIWANRMSYPFPDAMDMARVGQYVRTKYGAIREAREAYLDFIKNFLLDYAQRFGGVDPATLMELRNELPNYTFTDLAVASLGLLKFGPGCTDPLSVLASFPLPVYITTSYHNLLERALTAMEKKPITQVCFWSGKSSTLPDDLKPLTKFKPSPQTPLVFHLYGLEDQPQSMVLSEDDYMDFLVQLMLERGKTEGSFPAYLRSAISQSWLMMVGYRLLDWDFRTLFRSIISNRDDPGAGAMQGGMTVSTILQLSLADQYELPEDQDTRGQMTKLLSEAQRYLEKYFNPMSFEIQWKDSGTFLSNFKDQWTRRLR